MAEAVDIAELEKQYAELGEMITKLGGNTSGPKSQDADATAGGENIKKPSSKKHDQQVKNVGKKAADVAKKKSASDEEDAADGGDDEDMEKAKKAMADDEDAADGGSDDWSEEADGKKKGVKKAADEEITFDGQTVKKSAVGPIQFGLMKSMADKVTKAEEAIAKAQDEALVAKMEKRADAEFAHVPGSTQDRGKMLKALEGMDKDTRKAFEAVLKQSEKLGSVAFGKIGVAAGGDAEDIRKSVQDFDTKVSEIKKRDSLSQTDAMAKARKEHPDLFKAYQEAIAKN